MFSLRWKETSDWKLFIEFFFGVGFGKTAVHMGVTFIPDLDILFYMSSLKTSALSLNFYTKSVY